MTNITTKKGLFEDLGSFKGLFESKIDNIPIYELIFFNGKLTFNKDDFKLIKANILKFNTNSF